MQVLLVFLAVLTLASAVPSLWYKVHSTLPDSRFHSESSPQYEPHQLRYSGYVYGDDRSKETKTEPRPTDSQQVDHSPAGRVRCAESYSLVLCHLLNGRKHQTPAGFPFYRPLTPAGFPSYRPFSFPHDTFTFEHPRWDWNDETFENFPDSFPCSDCFDTPHISPIPDVDDLPDNYDNSTHEVHFVNGSRVVVNTTINKETGDNHNVFYHHRVIHITPDEETPNGRETPERQVPTEGENPEEQVPAEVTTKATGQSTEEPPAEEVTETNEIPYDPSIHAVPAEVVLPPKMTENEVVRRPSRAAKGDEAHPEGPSRASYVKHEDGVDQPPPDLSSDTIVNHLPSDDKHPKARMDPDAEVVG